MIKTSLLEAILYKDEQKKKNSSSVQVSTFEICSKIIASM